MSPRMRSRASHASPRPTRPLNASSGQSVRTPRPTAKGERSLPPGFGSAGDSINNFQIRINILQEINNFQTRIIKWLKPTLQINPVYFLHPTNIYPTNKCKKITLQIKIKNRGTGEILRSPRPFTCRSMFTIVLHGYCCKEA